MKHYAFARADLLAIVLTPVAPAVALRLDNGERGDCADE